MVRLILAAAIGVLSFVHPDKQIVCQPCFRKEIQCAKQLLTSQQQSARFVPIVLRQAKAALLRGGQATLTEIAPAARAQMH